MDTVSRIDLCDCPVLVFHSKDDNEIPVIHAKRIFEQARGPKKIVIYSGPHTGHNWLQVRDLSVALKELLRGDLESWDTAKIDLAYDLIFAQRERNSIR